MNPSHLEEHQPEEPRHNMLVVGEKCIFLSHLPMFMETHNLQFILQATFTKGDKGADQIYFDDRQSHRNTRIYTLQPGVIELEGLSAPGGPFTGSAFRGHLERGGHQIESLTDIQVNIQKIVYSQRFGPGFDKSDHLEYILFGKGQELFLAHVIAAPPDFDQIISVKMDDGPNADELSRGVRVAILGRKNAGSKRIKEGEKVQAQGHVAGAHQFLDLHIQAGVEFYFEEGDLATQM